MTWENQFNERNFPEKQQKQQQQLEMFLNLKSQRLLILKKNENNFLQFQTF